MIPNKKSLFLRIIDSGPYIIISFGFVVQVVSIISLLLVDVITGQITGEHVSRDSKFGLFVSMATTGLLTAFIAGVIQLSKSMLSQKSKKEKEKNLFSTIGLVLLFLVTLALYLLDGYFDSLSVDIKRFGEIIIPSEQLSPAEASAHILYRILVAGISSIGEPLGAASIATFPVLKSLLKSMVATFPSEQDTSTEPKRGEYYPPTARPVTNFTNSRPVNNTNIPQHLFRDR